MEYLLKASAVIALFYICFFLFFKKETFFDHNRWFLLVGLAMAVIFPFIIIPIEIAIEPLVPAHDNFANVESISSGSTTKSIDETFNWSSVLPIIYVTGVVIFIIQFAFQFGSLIRLFMKYPKSKDGTFTYVIIDKDISPFSFFKWIVYNPGSFTDPELELMLTHEKIHANQLHSLDLLLTQMACTIFWFNPLIWLYRKEVRQNLEFIADAKTQEITKTQKNYQRLLLKTSIGKQEIAFSNTFYNSLIKERIVMLKKSRSKNKNKWKYALIIPLVAGLLMSMNTETVYVEVDKNRNNRESLKSENYNEPIKVIFNNSMSDKNLQSIKKDLEAKGVKMNIKRLERNSEGKISDISITFETKNGTANYNANISEGIKSFYFEMNEDGNFGVGIMPDEQIIIVGKIQADENKNTSMPKSETFIHDKNEDKTYSVDSTKAKTYNKQRNVVIGRLKKKIENNDTIYYNAIDSAEIEKLTKLKSNIYYQSDKPVKIQSGDNAIVAPSNSKTLNNIFNSHKKALIILDNKEVSRDKLITLPPDLIDSFTVLKGEEATTIYGEKGKNGVVIIKTKENAEDSPWQIRTEVTSVGYIDENDASKNSNKAYISKYSTDDLLENHKNNLEKIGLKVKYSKLKRNKKDEIIKIKIKISNDEGHESSATYVDDDGIPNIEYGISAGALIVRTSTLDID